MPLAVYRLPKNRMGNVVLLAPVPVLIAPVVRPLVSASRHKFQILRVGYLVFVDCKSSDVDFVCLILVVPSELVLISAREAQPCRTSGDLNHGGLNGCVDNSRRRRDGDL